MQDIGEVTRRLWSLCVTLREEGISYQGYLTELSQLLFLKLCSERFVNDHPELSAYWSDLKRSSPRSLVSAYHETLARLAGSPSEQVAELFHDARTEIKSSPALERLVNGIDSVEWGELDATALGNVYEGLIEKGAQESRYGAGQYFTPRAVVDALIRVLQPLPSERVYDPAAGTAGFLVSAGLHAKERFGTQPALNGTELVTSVRKLGIMNCVMHNLDVELNLGDALDTDLTDRTWDVCVTNPPFGVRGRLPEDQAARLPFPTNNRQLAFLQHVAAAIGSQGRSAIVVPDNVLFEGGTASAIRRRLLDVVSIHTILHLPTGIFYATGIKTSVIFLQAGARTTQVWFYNLRNGSGSYGKRRVLDSEDFTEFLEAYGDRSDGRSARTETARFKPKSLNDLHENEYRFIFDEDLDESRGQESATVDELLNSLNDSISVAQAATLTIGDILASYGDLADAED